MAGKIILRTDIERKPGYLYYCGTEDGKIVVGEAVMARGGRGKGRPKKKK